MNFKFTVNEYLLIWNLLFKKSFLKELNNDKQKIWLNYKDLYSALKEEEVAILEDPKNYIPTNDTIYNIIKDLDVYTDIYRLTIKYKQNLIMLFDKYKRQINLELNNILKTQICDYEIFIVDPRLNLSTYILDYDNKLICYGKSRADFNSLVDIIYTIVEKEVLYILKDEINNENLICTLVDLAIRDEFNMRLTGNNYVLNPDDDYEKLLLYPYFVEYLGESKNGNDSRLIKKDFIDFIRYCDRILDRAKGVEVIEKL